MILRPTAVRARRRGATIVELALLMSIFLMFLFGILEYARYLFTLHVTTNAARDAARYASVRVNANPVVTGTAVTTSDPLFASTTIYSSNYKAWDVPEVTDYLKQRMGPRYGSAGAYTYYADQLITDMKVRAFPCHTTYTSTGFNDTVGLYDDPPVVKPKYNNTGWNNAGFSERIAVRVTGTYVPILPSFLWMGNTASIEIDAVMGSEG